MIRNSNTDSIHQSSTVSSKDCDILLSNFIIKKKRHRVLFNYDHIVWEQLHGKRSADDAESASNKDYSNRTNVVHINELIRVSKGHTKAAALQIAVEQANAEIITDFASRHSQAQQEHDTNTTSTTLTEQYLVLFYATRIIHSATDCNRWELRKLVLYNMDELVVQQWHELLNKMLLTNMPNRLRVRRLLVFINPFGGRKQVLQVYERHCKPLFQLAGIDASCIISQRSNQIRDILLTHDLATFDAVCCVGGDGTVAEVINGLIFRAIRDAAMDARQPTYVPKPVLPIAIIPAGSTDTIAYSLHGTSDVATAAIHLILGQRRGMDVCSVRNHDGILRFCASVLSYGYLGDVAEKSERYRWMGTKRYEFAGFKTFIANRGYEAQLRVLQPISSTKANGGGETDTSDRDLEETPDTICYVDCARCKEATVAEAKSNKACAMLRATDDNELPTPSSDSVKGLENSDDTASMEHLHRVTNDATKLPQTDTDYIKANDLKRYDNENAATLESNEQFRIETKSATSETELASQWTTINGKFFMISGANISCACTRSPKGVAPYSHIGDGYLDVVLVRKTSLLSNVRLLLNLMRANGDIRKLPFVETYRTKKLHFRAANAKLADDFNSVGSRQPITVAVVGLEDDDANLSHWNCDGEVINEQELTMISHCQLIDVFMRGPHTYEKLEQKTSDFCCSCCKSDN